MTSNPGSSQKKGGMGNLMLELDDEDDDGRRHQFIDQVVDHDDIQLQDQMEDDDEDEEA
jgi:hypothetical protein